jgi:hypothetical protein
MQRLALGPQVLPPPLLLLTFQSKGAPEPDGRSGSLLTCPPSLGAIAQGFLHLATHEGFVGLSLGDLSLIGFWDLARCKGGGVPCSS